MYITPFHFTFLRSLQSAVLHWGWVPYWKHTGVVEYWMSYWRVLVRRVRRGKPPGDSWHPCCWCWSARRMCWKVSLCACDHGKTIPRRTQVCMRYVTEQWETIVTISNTQWGLWHKLKLHTPGLKSLLLESEIITKCLHRQELSALFEIMILLLKSRILYTLYGVTTSWINPYSGTASCSTKTALDHSLFSLSNFHITLFLLPLQKNYKPWLGRAAHLHRPQWGCCPRTTSAWLHGSWRVRAEFGRGPHHQKPPDGSHHSHQHHHSVHLGRNDINHRVKPSCRAFK